MSASALVPVLVMTWGAVLVSLLFPHTSGRERWLEALGWGPAVGFGGLSTMVFFFQFFGLGNPRPLVVIGVIAATLATILVLRRWWALHSMHCVDATSEAIGPRPSRPPRAVVRTSAVALVAGVCGLGVAFATWSLQWPYGTVDAVNIWNSRARFLLLADRPMEQILHTLERGNPDYPLMLPASLAGQAAVWGSWSLAIPQVTQLAFLIGLAAMTFLGIRRFSTQALAVPGTAMLLAAPVLWRWAFSQGADLPMAYLLLASAVGLAAHLRCRDLSWATSALTGWTLGLLPWTKFEGLISFLALGVSFGLLWLFGYRHRRPRLRSVFVLAGSAVPPLLALMLFKSYWAPGRNVELFLANSPLARLTDPTLWTTALSTIADVVNPLDGGSLWGWIPPYLILCTLVLGARRGSVGRVQIFMGLTLVLVLLAILSIYVTSPFGLVHHIQRSADRLFFQLLPLALVWVFSLGRGLPGSAGLRGRG